ncbi:MAG TPA: hypothetical protein VHI53_01455 [Gaiellaceae bacterium]|jgi:hypothetical protein|nr:hypothetical protein [Gaiellaceae bacterium]
MLRTTTARTRAGTLALVVIVVAGIAALTVAASGSSNGGSLLARSQHTKMANGKALPHFSGGMEVVFDEEREEAADAQSSGSADNPPDATASALGCANRVTAGGNDVRVNQDCTLRRQAEEQVAVNPLDPSNIIAGQNDSRVGFNHCGFDYSLDGGAHWGDGQPGFFQHLNPGTLHTYDAASDPNVIFTGTGRAWYACVVFDLNTNASGVFAIPSTPALKGAAYANIGAGASPYVVAETNDGHTFYDKQFMAGDPRAGHEEAYITFSVFTADQKCSQGNNPGAYCSSEIFYSKWDGAKWSTPANVSGSSPTLCVLGDFFDKKADPNACNFNQGSMPVVLANGDVYVVWNNGNTPIGAPNQTLGRLIHPNGTMGPVVKVGVDDWRHQANCELGRGPEECVDSLKVRTNDFPAIATDPSNANHLVAVWQDSRDSPNADGDYGIAIAESANGGATWTETKYLKGAAGEAYFEPSVAVTKTGKIAVSFYKANVYGNSDGMGTYGYYLRHNGSSSWPSILVSDSATNPSPQANPTQAGFLGDYTSIAASTAAGSNVVYPIWADTRNLSDSQGPDQDVFIQPVTLP